MKEGVHMKIADLNISARAKSCLLRAGYSDIEDLQGISNDILLNIKNINLNCVSEIRNAIDSLQSMKDNEELRYLTDNSDLYMHQINDKQSVTILEKQSSTICALKELLIKKEYKLPFRIKSMLDDNTYYELQTIKDGFVYAEIFRDGKSADYCRFNIYDTQKFIIMKD